MLHVAENIESDPKSKNGQCERCDTFFAPFESRQKKNCKQQSNNITSYFIGISHHLYQVILKDK